MAPLAAELLEVLACPRCKGPLRYVAQPEAIECPACRLRFRVDDGIPVMLVEEAETISPT